MPHCKKSRANGKKNFLCFPDVSYKEEKRRPSYAFGQVDTSNAHEIGTMEYTCQRVIPNKFMQSIDAVGRARDDINKKKVHVLEYSKTPCDEADGRSKGFEWNLLQCPGSSNSDDGATSVGSCSVAVIDIKAENNCFCPEKEVDKGKLEAEIHSLELDAYQKTLEALYASGPLSWEKEGQGWCHVSGASKV